MRYILGVDGGNTKTDYFLFDENASFVDIYRGMTCSHEALEDSFEGTYKVMINDISMLLKRNNLEVKDIASACFGLAGVDIPMQKACLEDIARKIGFTNFVVVNDSFLGIKAGTKNGYGICSINGTATSNGGIDKDGNYLQVGGIGDVSGDLAGGMFIAKEVVKVVYNEAYRMGEKTSLTPILFDMLDLKDKYYFLESISMAFYNNTLDYVGLVKACFQEAMKGDNVSKNILITMGDEVAKSGAGVITNMNFDDDVEVVLAGSVWVKGITDIAIKEYKKKINEYTNKNCIVNVLEVPPATGAIIWAKELLDNSFPTLELRNSIIDSVANKLGELD